MRLPPAPGWTGTLLARLRGTHFGGFFRGQQAGGRLPSWGLGVIWAVLAWPLNGGMKAIVCLLSVCVDWAQPYGS